jgi:hypothetical protein
MELVEKRAWRGNLLEDWSIKELLCFYMHEKKVAWAILFAIFLWVTMHQNIIWECIAHPCNNFLSNYKSLLNVSFPIWVSTVKEYLCQMYLNACVTNISLVAFIWLFCTHLIFPFIYFLHTKWIVHYTIINYNTFFNL